MLFKPYQPPAHAGPVDRRIERRRNSCQLTRLNGKTAVLPIQVMTQKRGCLIKTDGRQVVVVKNERGRQGHGDPRSLRPRRVRTGGNRIIQPALVFGSRCQQGLTLGKKRRGALVEALQITTGKRFPPGIARFELVQKNNGSFAQTERFLGQRLISLDPLSHAGLGMTSP